jgi:predicted component of type VI protein secretion system
LAHEHPQVAERHCEIVWDRLGFQLVNHSGQETLVNDTPVIGSVLLRAGDRIRLGEQGPLLRFLGQGRGRPSLYYTTA